MSTVEAISKPFCSRGTLASGAGTALAASRQSSECSEVRRKLSNTEYLWRDPSEGYVHSLSSTLPACSVIPLLR